MSGPKAGTCSSTLAPFAEGFRTLTEGQKVEYTVTQGQKGPQAQDVSLVAAEVQKVAQAKSVTTAIAEVPAASPPQEESAV